MYDSEVNLEDPSPMQLFQDKVSKLLQDVVTRVRKDVIANGFTVTRECLQRALCAGGSC